MMIKAYARFNRKLVRYIPVVLSKCSKGYIIGRALNDPIAVVIAVRLLSVSAERRDAECFAGERHPRTGGGPLPCLVHYVLRFAVASSPRCPAIAAKKLSIARLSGNAAGAPAFREALTTLFKRGFFEIGIPSPPRVSILYRP